jgi:flagellar basal body-associated protein FliL
MNENMNTPVEEKPKSKTPMIIGIVVAVLLCCCCTLVAAYFLGDQVLSSLGVTY